MTKRRLIIAMVMVACAFAVSTPAAAQPNIDPRGSRDAKQQAADAQEQAPKVKVERSRGGRKVFRITTGFVIEGRIQKPNAFYVLQRSQINYDWAALKKNFLPRIMESVTKEPF